MAEAFVLSDGMTSVPRHEVAVFNVNCCAEGPVVTCTPLGTIGGAHPIQPHFIVASSMRSPSENGVEWLQSKSDEWVKELGLSRSEARQLYHTCADTLRASKVRACCTLPCLVDSHSSSANALYILAIRAEHFIKNVVRL